MNKQIRKGVELGNGNVMVDGVEYLKIKRRAKEGELFYINKPGLTFGDYKKGDVLTVCTLPKEFSGVYAAEIHSVYIGHNEYVVLEPVVTSKNNNDRLLERITSAIDELIEIKHELAGRELGRSMSKIAKIAEKQNRQEIIDMAKMDVKELLNQNYHTGDYPHLSEGGVWFVSKGIYFVTSEVEFVVNKEKRTVVALIKKPKQSPTPFRKGIAKCAPNDCFNVHIGKAIALRRALGLDVPEAYLNAPQPTRAEVGDVVKTIESGLVITLTRRNKEYDCGLGRAFKHSADNWTWVGEEQFKIIDDSRE